VDAAIYARLSRDDARDGLGVDRQLADCRALLTRQGVDDPRAYVDNDFSAYSGKPRPEYRRLLVDIEAGRVGTVVAWAPERLHRSPRELEDFIELIERTGTKVETVKAGTWDVSTSHGRLVARMLGAVSRAESERTGERVSRAHQQAKERGYWRGPIPYGLKASSTPGQPEVEPGEAAVVREIFDRLRRGDALVRIAADLNAIGSRPRRGVAWTHTGLSRLIASPAIGGMIRLGNELRPAAFDGVLSEPEWRAGVASLERRPRGEMRRPREKLTLLGGIMRCGEHGHVCVGSSAAHGATYSAGLPGQCYVGIVRTAADLAVKETIVARLSLPDAASMLQPHVDHDGLAAQATALRQRRDDIARLIGEGLLTGDAARPQLQSLGDQLVAIESKLAPAMQLLTSGANPREAWEGWTMPQRRELVRTLFDRVELAHVGLRNGPRADPTRVTVTWAAHQS
jgi:site-specific DNA recombinase